MMMILKLSLVFLILSAVTVWQGAADICKDDDAFVPKYLGDPCTSDNECKSDYMNGGAMGAYICEKGVCTCGIDYIEEKGPGNRTGCASKPTYSYLGQPCTTVCAAPFTCMEANVTTTPQPLIGPNGKPPLMPFDNGPGPGQIAIMPMAQSPRKTCQCLPPYKYSSYTCSKTCSPDEIQLSNGDCRKKCAGDEIFDQKSQNSCKKIASLDQPCDIDAQCTVSFSSCQAGACKCKDGFNAKDGKCETTTYNCRGGGQAVLQPNGSITPCMLLRILTPIQQVPYPPLYSRPSFLQDTCGQGQWCQVLLSLTKRPLEPNEGDRGFCCTTPPPTCPVGQPYSAAPFCAAPIYATSETLSSFTSSSCPKSHECLPSLTPGPPVCCPKICPPGQINVGTNCYQQKLYGEQCQVDEQCQAHRGKCLQGRCTCGPDYTTFGTSGPESARSCYRQCTFDEYVINFGECAPRQKLGQPCKNNNAQCPQNAYCNKQGVCACRCSYTQISDKVCGRQTFCPGPRSSDAPIFCKGSQFKATLFNVTTVDQCPDDKVCYYYVDSLGVCCPKPPEAKCPPNWTRDGPCGQGPSPCAPTANCFMYYQAANRTDHTGGVCCTPPPPSSNPGIMPRVLNGTATTPIPTTPFTTPTRPPSTPYTTPTSPSP